MWSRCRTANDFTLETTLSDKTLSQLDYKFQYWNGTVWTQRQNLKTLRNSAGPRLCSIRPPVCDLYTSQYAFVKRIFVLSLIIVLILLFLFLLADCWIVVDERVYDVTKWLPLHPGTLSYICAYTKTIRTQQILLSNTYTRSLAHAHARMNLQVKCFS